eukprot:SAG11_NODE_2065_length_3869_cov_1.739523_3_plen_43_part_00
MDPVEADNLSAFLIPMLQLQQEKRATAAQALEHEWVSSSLVT